MAYIGLIGCVCHPKCDSGLVIRNLHEMIGARKALDVCKGRSCYVEKG